MKPLLNVLIIGAGKIGALSDEPNSSYILTHAHAFKQHKGFNLLGFLDCDFSRAKYAAHKWGCQPYKDLNTAFSEHNIDIVVVSTPDTTHYSILKRLIRYRPRLVLAEKPLTTTLKTSKIITEIYEKEGVDLAVNLSRRYIPEYEVLKQDILHGNYGNFVAGSGYYGKGIVHNGIHMIDTLIFLLGKPSIIGSQFTSLDFYGKDKNVSTLLKLGNEQYFYIHSINSKLYTIFEYDLLFQKARIKIDDSSFQLNEYSIKPNKVFKGFYNLELSKNIRLSQNQATYFVAHNIYKHIYFGERLKCDGQTVITSMSICEKIKATSR